MTYDLQNDEDNFETFKSLADELDNLSDSVDWDEDDDEDLLAEKCEQLAGRQQDLESQISQVLHQLSFTEMHIHTDERRKALEQYLNRFTKKTTQPPKDFEVRTRADVFYPHRMQFLPDHALQMAQWYSANNKLDHAVAVYEYVHGLFERGTPDIWLSREQYLPQMILAYAALEDIARLVELEALARDAADAGALSADIGRMAESAVAKIVGLHPEKKLKPEVIKRLSIGYEDLQNELENAKFEIALLEKGVLLEDERQKTREWLEQHHGGLMITVTDSARKYLTNAIMCARERKLREIFGSWIPVEIGKAIEAQFNVTVWKEFRQTRLKLPERYNHDKLSINMIYTILSGLGNLSEKAWIKPIQGKIQKQMISNALFNEKHLSKLKIVKDHSTKARHGQLGADEYKKPDLEQFLREIELREETGWIFTFLTLLRQGTAPRTTSP